MTIPLTFWITGSNSDKLNGGDRSRRLARWGLVLGVLSAPVVLALAVDAYAPQRNAPAGVRMIGVFTGEFANGAPVNRLPPVEVSASRRAELAKIAREERDAHAKPAQFSSASSALLSVDAAALRNIQE